MNNQRNTQESNIDKKYREILFRYTLTDAVRIQNARVQAFSMSCPFCSENRKPYNKKARCGVLLWDTKVGCYLFSCKNMGAYDCKFSMQFPKFLEKSSPPLFREYQIERFHAGTTGGRWNCPDPPSVEKF